MADYVGVTRSSYFRVTDEEKYKKLVYGLYELEDYEERSKDGTVWHMFAGYNGFEFYPNTGGSEDEDDTPDLDFFCRELAKIILPGDACVVMTVGNENLRYITGDVCVITHMKVMWNGLENIAKDILKKQDINPQNIKLYY